MLCSSCYNARRARHRVRKRGVLTLEPGTSRVRGVETIRLFPYRCRMVNLVLHCCARHVERRAVEKAETLVISMNKENWRFEVPKKRSRSLFGVVLRRGFVQQVRRRQIGAVEGRKQLLRNQTPT